MEETGLREGKPSTRQLLTLPITPVEYSMGIFCDFLNAPANLSAPPLALLSPLRPDQRDKLQFHLHLPRAQGAVERGADDSVC